jgi:hypothetical protein
LYIFHRGKWFKNVPLEVKQDYGILLPIDDRGMIHGKALGFP